MNECVKCKIGTNNTSISITGKRQNICNTCWDEIQEDFRKGFFIPWLIIIGVAFIVLSVIAIVIKQ